MTTLMGCPTLATAPHTALMDTKGNLKKGFLCKKKEMGLCSDQLAAMGME